MIIDKLKLVHAGNTIPVGVILRDHFRKIAVEEPSGGDLPEDIFTNQLWHCSTAIDEPAGDGVTVGVAVLCDRVGGNYRRGDAIDRKRVCCGKRHRRTALAAG